MRVPMAATSGSSSLLNFVQLLISYTFRHIFPLPLETYFALDTIEATKEDRAARVQEAF